nr:hypothetical protein [Tanacetum cinerariifolium]
NPTQSSEFLTKSSSTSPKSFLEETNTFHNFLSEFENFCFDLEEISSGSTTTDSDISLPDYEFFYFHDDHIEEISSGSTTTHYDISLSEYDSFTFDLSNDQCPPTDRSDFTHEDFAEKLAHIMSPPEYDCFYFRNLPDPGELMSILNFGIRENLFSTTSVNLPVEDDHSPLLAYVVWIFLAYLTYPVIHPYLHSFRNEDTIFDAGITINRVCSFKPGLSHRIPFEDPYEEAAQQLFEQAPHPPEYVPRDHVPVFVPEFEHPEDLVPAEGEAPTIIPPSFTTPIRAPPLLPISTPSTSRRARIPEANTPPQNRPLLAAPRPGCEVGESSAAAAKRQGPAMAHEVDCSY